MTLLQSGVTTRPVARPAGPVAAHAWWAPLWLRRQREERELARWAAAVRWRWSDTMDGAHLAHYIRTAGGIPHLVAPSARSVEPGPPVTLLVEMLPGQLVNDFQAQAHRIAEGMGVPMVHIAPHGRGWIKVALLDH